MNIYSNPSPLTGTISRSGFFWRPPLEGRGREGIFKKKKKVYPPNVYINWEEDRP